MFRSERSQRSRRLLAPSHGFSIREIHAQVREPNEVDYVRP